MIEPGLISPALIEEKAVLISEGSRGSCGFQTGSCEGSVGGELLTGGSGGGQFLLKAGQGVDIRGEDEGACSDAKGGG